MNKPYFCRKFFPTDWRHKRLKNKIDLLLFYREHFYGFIVCIGVSTPPQKHHPLFLVKPPPFQAIPSSKLVFHESSNLKVFILNTILFFKSN